MSQVTGAKGNDRHLNGEWMRPAFEVEKLLIEKDFKIWYLLDLRSLQPLDEEDVRKALTHFYKKASNMCVCFGQNQGELWVRKATNQNVDFKVVRGVSLEDMKKTIGDYHYNLETGPLFCARLILDAPDSDIDPFGLDPSFPFKSHIIFGFYHATTDGTSNMHLMGLFMTLLNDVIAKRPINDDEPFGVFRSEEENGKLLSEKKVVLQGNPELKKPVIDAVQQQVDNIPWSAKVFPGSGSKPSIKAISKCFDPATTARFIQRCKQEKVTVNSAICAVTNMAIVDLVKGQGVNQDSYIIQDFHIINFRRYWPSKPPVSLGPSLSFPIRVYADTPKDVRSKFWSYTRDIGQNLKDKIAYEEILVYQTLSTFFPEELPKVDEKQPVGDFLTSSMGDVTNMVTEGGDHVRVTNLTRGSVFYSIPYGILLNYNTFRGIFSIMMDCQLTILQRSFVEKLLSQIEKCLLEVIEL